LDVGGRYQTIQVLRMGCSKGVEADLPVREEEDPFCLILSVLLLVSLSLDSAAACEKSTLPPGVFGTLLGAPKEANAPVPSPNADEAPGVVAVGVATFSMLLKGFAPPCEEVVPKRLAEGNARGESVLESLLPFELEVLRDSLLELLQLELVGALY
jgi:hypothetical protein